MPVLYMQSKFEYKGLLIKASVITTYDRPGTVRCGVYHDVSFHTVNFHTDVYESINFFVIPLKGKQDVVHLRLKASIRIELYKLF